MKPHMTIDNLKDEAAAFAISESNYDEPSIYGVTDGKAIGTYLEHKFQDLLSARYTYEKGSSAKGIDFPSLNVDMKVTSIKQPQSSSPFKSACQKIFGLGYSLLVFVYYKTDNGSKQTGRLKIVHAVFIDKSRTADYQTTSGILEILDNDGNADDLYAFFEDRNIPLDDVSMRHLADEVLANRPHLGFLTISNALQWRLQYNRVIDKAGLVDGIVRVH